MSEEFHCIPVPKELLVLEDSCSSLTVHKDSVCLFGCPKNEKRASENSIIMWKMDVSNDESGIGDYTYSW